jgi:hypothetical protein
MQCSVKKAAKKRNAFKVAVILNVFAHADFARDDCLYFELTIC